MTLHVEPSAITSFSRRLDRATDDALDTTFTRLISILDASAPEVAATATYYLQTDRHAAAVIDRTLPSALGQCPTTLEYEFTAIVCKPVPFTDPRLVTGHLTPPPEPDNPPNSLGFMDYLSPTSWAMKGFDIIRGFDPIAWVQEKFSGDAAYNYFTNLSTSIAALAAPLTALADEYKKMADAVWSAGEMIGGLIKGMIDGAIIAGIAAAAGTATSWTGIGAVAGYGVAAVEVANVIRLWSQATQLYQYAGAAVLAFRSKLGSELSNIEGITLAALPGGTGYKHPSTGLTPTR